MDLKQGDNMQCRLTINGKILEDAYFKNRYEGRYLKKAKKVLNEAMEVKVKEVWATFCPHEKLAYKTYLVTEEGVLKLATGGSVDAMSLREFKDEVKFNPSIKTTIEDVCKTWKHHLEKGTLNPQRFIERHLMEMANNIGTQTNANL